MVELFTSQGCSSCPPADRILTELGTGRRSDVLPLAFHVDYWNSIGWTDPFSSPQWSARQKAYAAAWRGSQVYTPQMVVGGSEHLVGSASGAMQAAVTRRRNQPAFASVTVREVSRDATQITVAFDARLEAGRSGHVQVALFENGVITEVKRGENAGRSLRNDYIVRSLTTAVALSKGGSVTGRQARLPIRAGWRSTNVGVAVFVQDPTSLVIHGAAGIAAP